MVRTAGPATLLLFRCLLLGVACGPGFTATAQQRAQVPADHPQHAPFTHYDTLRGALGPARAYDVTFYGLDLRIDPPTKSIAGHNDIYFRALDTLATMQIDLFANMAIDSITCGGVVLPYVRTWDFVFVTLPVPLLPGQGAVVRVAYHGQPRQALMAPWDGGFVWQQDDNGRPWVGVACEGIGASLWWPNKDHLSDEPDSVAISLSVPTPLVAVANGQLRGRTVLDSGRVARYDWFVSYPINNYNVTLNVGDYAHLTDHYTGGNGDTLALDYYVLRGHQAVARDHFEQVGPMLTIFERFFGPYPFWRDGYALVETPYWGMEHQGAIAYGNGFKNLPRWDFDYIIVHESGHEYWGNSVSCGDHAEMWIHESFCTYAELLYVEARFGADAVADYLRSQLKTYPIANAVPMLGPMNVNYTDWDDADMYYKGAWMLHTLRASVRDDSLWFAALRGLATTFRRQVVASAQVIDYLGQALGRDLHPFFAQYLQRTEPPRLVYRFETAGHATTLNYRWENTAPDFTLPLRVRLPGTPWRWLSPTSTWQQLTLDRRQRRLEIDEDHFYVQTRQIHAP